MQRSSREQRFDAWWPEEWPFPPSTPWIGAAVTRELARKVMCLGPRPSRSRPKNFTKNISVTPAMMPSAPGGSKSIIVDTDGLRAVEFPGNYKRQIIIAVNALVNEMDTDYPTMNVPGFAELEQSIIEKVKNSKYIAQVIVIVEDGGYVDTNRDARYIDYTWWCGISHSVSTGIGVRPTIEEWGFCQDYNEPESGSDDIDISMGGKPITPDPPASGPAAGTSDPVTIYLSPIDGTVVIATSEGYVGSAHKKFDANNDGKVTICEWLAGLFGCVPPPWVPDMYITVLGGYQEISPSDLESSFFHLDNQIADEEPYLKDQLRNVLTPMEWATFRTGINLYR